MTVLCGDPTFTGYSASGPSGLDGAYLAAAPFIASVNGMVSALYCTLNPTVAQSFVMGLYDGVSQNLVYSAPIMVQPSQGLVAFPINPTPVRQLSAYQILLMPQGTGTFTFGVDSTLPTLSYRVLGANNAFPVPPYQLTGALPSVYGAPAFYADGSSTAQTTGPSGVIGQTVLDTSTVISRAFNRARLRAQQITDEMVQIAKEELFLFLTSDLANRGVQLFAVDIQLVPFTQGLAGVPMPPGTIDVLNANYRFMNPLQTGPSTSYAPGSASPATVNTIAITWGGPAVPFQVLMGSTVLASFVPDASAGQTTLYDLDGGIASANWSIQANPVPPNPLSAGTLNVTNVTFYQTGFQVPLTPYSRDDFSYLSNTFFPSRPFQYWLDRQDPWPIMRLWPTPTLNDQTNACLVIWRHRQIQDVGFLYQRLNVPNRWLDAVIDNLAFRIGRDVKEVDPSMMPNLERWATQSLNKVRENERENAPMRIQPQIRYYTR